MEEDNLTRQTDEIEALSSIYGEDWCVLDASSRRYCIEISAQSSPAKKVNLQVVFPPDYPSSSPPEYQLNAQWLKGDERIEMSNSLEEIFAENMGESIIYLWVEKIREFLANETQTGAGACVENNVTEETDLNYSDDFHPETVKNKQENVKNITAASIELEVPAIYSGDTISDRRSTFQPFLAAVHSREEVKLVMDQMLQNKKIANATHNMVAYRIKKEPEGTFLMGCKDDGETHAGSRMLHLLTIVDAKNVMVVVSRWYGGIHLGPDRFKYINQCTRQILEAQGYIAASHKDEKKASKGKKGKHHS